MKKPIFIFVLITTLIFSLFGFTSPATGAINSLIIFSGNNQTINVNTNSEGLVVIARDVGGNPVLGVGVNFSVSSTPAGAVGQTVAPTFATTTPQGLAATIFRAGNLAGAYTVLAQAGVYSATFTVNAVAGMQPATVTAIPAVVNALARYNLVFNVSSSGALSVGGRITITFPLGTTVPTTIAAAQVRINGLTPTITPTVSGRTVNVFTPVAIANNGAMEVQFLEGAGIINPATATNYRLSVSTVADTSVVESNIYALIAGLSPALVITTPNTVNSIAQYRINFSVSPTGALTIGNRITVEFPLGTTVPTTIAAAQVRINGLTPTITPTISGRTVNVFTPVAIANSGAVELQFLEGAGIANPTTAGDYRLRVVTQTDTTSVDSSVYSIIIVVTPTTTIATTPINPDGLAGWFRTSPFIFLTSTSPGGAVTIFYRWGATGSFLTYTAPIRPPEGINTLHYYGRDVALNLEATKTREFRVDTIAPVITVTNFPEGGFVNTPSVILEGTVEVGATLTLNDRPIIVGTNGAFIATLTLNPTGSTILTWVANDLAGNNTVLVQTLVLDTLPPSLEITSPAKGSTIRTAQVELKGRTEASATVRINNVEVQVATDGSFQTQLTLVSGSNAIVVVATDRARNTTTETFTIIHLPTLIIVAQIGNRTAQVNDKPVILEAAPVIRNGRTMVPFRFLAESFGAEIIWDGVFKIIMVSFEGKRIVLQVDNNIASVNGVAQQLEVAPTVINGRTMVPIRFIAEQFNSAISYHAATRTITIVNPKP